MRVPTAGAYHLIPSRSLTGGSTIGHVGWPKCCESRVLHPRTTISRVSPLFLCMQGAASPTPTTLLNVAKYEPVDVAEFPQSTWGFSDLPGEVKLGLQEFLLSRCSCAVLFIRSFPIISGCRIIAFPHSLRRWLRVCSGSVAATVHHFWFIVGLHTGFQHFNS